MQESAGLLVPYLMWVKMSASVGVVVIIFLSTNYRMSQVGTQLMLHMSLMMIHGICFHVVHQYDTQVTYRYSIIILVIFFLMVYKHRTVSDFRFGLCTLHVSSYFACLHQFLIIHVTGIMSVIVVRFFTNRI